MTPVDRVRVTAEEKRCALDDVLNSVALARSDRLKNLLRFLCEAEIAGRSSDLREYEIGVQALGQPQGYSPLENSAVRSRVHELRRRLEKFYSTEAPEASIRIQLLKGSYLPTFVHSDAIAPEFRGGAAAAPKRWLWLSVAAFLAGAVGMFLVLSYGPVARGRSGPMSTPAKASAGALWTPELEAIWSPFLDPKVPLLMSFESRLFVRIGLVNVRDWTIDEMDRVGSSKYLMAIKELFHQPQLYENRNYADFGAVQAAFKIARLLGSRNPRLLLKRSSGLAPEDIRDSDIIFLSKPSTDPALRHLLAQGPFIDERLRIWNLNPRPGELKEYVARPDPKDPDRSGERHLLITLMPGFHQNRRILSLACFNSEDPWALAEYLTTPERAKEMYDKMRLPGGKMPEFYQVVVKVQFRAQSPVHIEYVTHRVLSSGDRKK
jgi:hypothetical protein